MMFFLLLFHAAVKSLGAPVVKTPMGSVIGRFDGNSVARFAAIPYAVPPLGNRRFTPAELSETPWNSGSGKLDGMRFGTPCLQAPAGDPNEHPDPEAPPPSEDCLFLNVWTPWNKTSNSVDLSGQPWPVAVYIHGGGFMTGAGSSRWLNFSNIVLENGIVGVTINYRLGPLGFMVSDDFPGPGNGGMNGLRDQIVALKWIQKYIHHFGGDKRHVSIFGESSGGSAVCALSVAPEANGLFHAALVQSGPCVDHPRGRSWAPLSLKIGFDATRLILQNNSANSLEELRSVPGEDIQWPDKYMSDHSLAPYFSGYFVDDGLIPGSIEDRFRKGLLNPSRMIIGTTSYDGTAAFYGTAPTLGFIASDKKQTTPQAWLTAMQMAWGPRAQEVMRQYPLERFEGSPQRAFVRADADAFVVCPSRRVAALSAKHMPTWIYYFEHNTGNNCDVGSSLDVTVPNMTTPGWASHGSDVPFWTGQEVGPGDGELTNPVYCPKRAGTPEGDLSQLMRRQLGSFFRNRSLVKEHAWPMYNQHHPQVYRYATTNDNDKGSGVTHDPVDEDCRFWMEFDPPPARLSLSGRSFHRHYVVATA